MTNKDNPAIEVLTSIAEKLTMIGMYPSPGEAIKALALAQIEQDIAKYQKQIAAFEEKYGMSFEDFTAHIRGRATMEEEIDWEEWDDAKMMLEIRKKNREAIMSYVTTPS